MGDKETAARAKADETALDDVPPGVSGGVLIAAIKKRAVELGMSAADVAEHLGISYTYYSALMTGRRPIASLRTETIRLIAQLLRTSVVQIYVWAEVIRAEDFLFEDTLEDVLEVSYTKMYRDPKWGTIVPEHEIWLKTPVASRLAIILLYEQIAHVELIEKVKGIDAVEVQQPASKRA